MPALDLPDCPMAVCWRLLKARLEADATLKDAGVEFEFSEDRDAIRSPGDVPHGKVVVFVSGRMERWDWANEHSHSGALVLSLAVVVRSHDFEDVANLQTAIFKAVYDATNADTFRVSLSDEGAETGQCLVTRPLAPYRKEKNNDFVVLAGEMALEVQTFIFGA